MALEAHSKQMPPQVLATRSLLEVNALHRAHPQPNNATLLLELLAQSLSEPRLDATTSPSPGTLLVIVELEPSVVTKLRSVRPIPLHSMDAGLKSPTVATTMEAKLET